MAKLVEFCKINMGQSPDSSSYNDIGKGMPFFQGNADFGNVHPKVRVWCDAPTKIAHPNDILISVRAPIGALNIANIECCIGRGLASLTADKNKCHQKYLWYALESKVDELNSKGTGSTFKAISKSVLFDTEIPLPSLDGQKEISDIFDRITSLIADRKQQLKDLENLVKSRFIELFGEVETNIKGFPMKRMDECCKFIGGAQPDKSHFEYEKTDENIRLIQIRDYKSDRFITYIPKSLAKKTCTSSDIMIGRYGPPIFQILGGIEGAYNVALMKAIPTDEFNVEYFRCFLKNEKLLRYLESFSQRTAGQDGIQIDKLNAYPCFVPPIDLQNEFATFVEQTDKLKFDNLTWLVKVQRFLYNTSCLGVCL